MVRVEVEVVGGELMKVSMLDVKLSLEGQKRRDRCAARRTRRRQ